MDEPEKLPGNFRPASFFAILSIKPIQRTGVASRIAALSNRTKLTAAFLSAAQTIDAIENTRNGDP
jgi:hypothetical protein